MAALDVLPLADAKEHLNIPADHTQHDAELTRFIEAVVRAVERRHGLKLYSRAVTERRTASSGVILLSGVPVSSLTSIAAVGGSVYDAADFALDGEAGIVSTVSGAALFGRFDVAYQLGYAQVPADYQLAVKIIVEKIWSKSQRRPLAGARAGGPQPELEIVARGLFPSEALQLLPDPVKVMA